MKNTLQSHMTRRSFVQTGFIVGATLLAGCGRASASSQKNAETKTTASEGAGSTSQETAGASESTSSGRTLVAYYSRADENYGNGGTEWLEVGHTKVMADYIAEALGADTYEIVPKTAYPKGYDDCCDVALEEQGSDARPAIANALPDVAKYDVVFVGCPIWWGDEPMIVRTFLEGVDLAGKKVVPFTTHGGSGLGRVPSNFAKLLPNAKLLDGHAVVGTAVDGAREEVAKWATGLALT